MDEMARAGRDPDGRRRRMDPPRAPFLHHVAGRTRLGNSRRQRQGDGALDYGGRAREQKARNRPGTVGWNLHVTEMCGLAPSRWWVGAGLVGVAGSTRASDAAQARSRWSGVSGTPGQRDGMEPDRRGPMGVAFGTRSADGDSRSRTGARHVRLPLAGVAHAVVNAGGSRGQSEDGPATARGQRTTWSLRRALGVRGTDKGLAIGEIAFATFGENFPKEWTVVDSDETFDPVASTTRTGPTSPRWRSTRDGAGHAALLRSSTSRRCGKPDETQARCRRVGHGNSPGLTGGANYDERARCQGTLSTTPCLGLGLPSSPPTGRDPRRRTRWVSRGR